jgi:CheY-like chemotaxis protein
MKRRNKNHLKISEIAKQAGVLPSTIRYYTDIGLLKVASETPGGHRLYDKEYGLAKINKIHFLNKMGKTMEDIRKELSETEGKKKILLIDDEPELGDLVTQLVKTNFPDCEIQVVYDGFKAGRLLSEYLPDLIILDIMLPGVNGFDVCRQIRTSKHLSNTKILAVSGFNSEENRKKIIECGANDFMTKPIDIKVLKEKIETLTGSN